MDADQGPNRGSVFSVTMLCAARLASPQDSPALLLPGTHAPFFLVQDQEPVRLNVGRAPAGLLAAVFRDGSCTRVPDGRALGEA